MRIRSVFVIAFLFSALVPAAFYGWWAYSTGVKKEFNEVKDRHLLIAKNLGKALERYHMDLVAVTEAVADHLISQSSHLELKEILYGLNIECQYILDKNSMRILGQLTIDSSKPALPSYALIQDFIENAVDGRTTFSPVLPGAGNNNVIYALRSYGDKISIAGISTEYFVALGQSVKFGRRGHAAIVDHQGNVLSHPLKEWIKQRKNISKISAVKRMLAGEVGIEQFYSPALKGDMVAGITGIKGPGWGVMIPQPVEEIYEKVVQNNQFLVLIILLAVLVTAIMVSILLNSVSRPLTKIISDLKRNAASSELRNVELPKAMLSIKEMADFQESYNRMVSKVGKANTEIKELAYLDNVTKLPNRLRFTQLAKKAIGEPDLSNSGGCFLFLDIDNFKIVNDLYGHEAGDELLRIFANKFSNVAQDFDQSSQGNHIASPIVSRIGGDEFTILVPGLTNLVKLEELQQKLLESISSANDETVFSISCGVSIGSARYPIDGRKVSDLMRKSDIAMYKAKRSGKNLARIYCQEIGVFTENEIRSEFANAIADGQLYLEYQPKVGTLEKSIVGVEALVRWNHPTFGRLSPDDWLPAISRTSLGSNLCEWVISTAMRDMRSFEASGHKLNVAVNISSEQLLDKQLLNKVTHYAEEYNIRPALFEIEVTENTLFANEDQAFEVLAQIHKKGFKISIDDFGTGYSNLARLSRLKVDSIKLDKSLIARGLVDKRVLVILEATSTMAKNLGCKIVAEGIETLEAAIFAENLGADLLQGYYFSPSLGTDALLSWLDRAEFKQIDAYKKSALKAA